MTINLKGKDMLAISDWDKSELDQVLDLAFKFKRMGDASRSLDILKGKTLLLLWFKRSTRTWNSFTGAMEQLGGFVRSRDAKDLWIRIEETPGSGFEESLKDTALVLDRYIDALGIRLTDVTPEQAGRPPKWGDAQAVMQKLADYMKAPVLNMASDMHHPTQSMTDIMVMKEKLSDVRGKKSVLMWAYSPRIQGWGSAYGFPLVSATFGMDVTIACPAGYEFNTAMMTHIQSECAKADRKFEISHDLKTALEGADAVYPRNWRQGCYLEASDEETERRLAAQHKNWRLTESLLKVTNNARFMHTMPFSRGYEVDESVADGPNAIIYDQAENLLHMRKAFLASLLADSSVLEKL